MKDILNPFTPDEIEAICAIPKVWDYIQEEVEEEGEEKWVAIYHNLSIERVDGKLVIHNIDGRYLGTT